MPRSVNIHVSKRCERSHFLKCKSQINYAAIINGEAMCAEVSAVMYPAHFCPLAVLTLGLSWTRSQRVFRVFCFLTIVGQLKLSFFGMAADSQMPDV